MTLVKPIPEFLNWRGRQGPLCRPPSIEPICNKFALVPGVRRPFRERFCHAAALYESVRSCVVCLGFLARPPAVIRSIAQAVINPVDRLTRWSLAHIVNEVLECKPSIANGNSTPTIPTEILVIGVGATLNDSAPNVISFGVGFSVRGIALGCDFTPKAATRSSKPTPEVVCKEQTSIPAFALAIESGGNAAFWANRDNCKTPKNLTRKVYEFSHSALLNVAHLMVHGRNRCGFRSGATLAMHGAF